MKEENKLKKYIYIFFENNCDLYYITYSCPYVQDLEHTKCLILKMHENILRIHELFLISIKCDYPKKLIFLNQNTKLAIFIKVSHFCWSPATHYTEILVRSCKKLTWIVYM